ncbi:concanavalin A-like lectin/glucanase domain-containing protein [Durotheca rogersii]|uniref:concanavalin A-like lectin/glucanase domain-containing protein n=1 Tax=Durotheca rogersii TaxID=419775 RepID=UPI0022211097|nr:concanavalin A-like lectin/glucanase domain-containing protein [Durotheca rogersii]KAI5866784.1 concanavalin A-like lectin/glucanase domain-containing protein [Durotheca rogersii]
MAYSITAHYAGQRLLDSFNFFTGVDPNHGFANYQSKEDALAQGLVSINTDYNAVKLGVDASNTYLTSDKGRPSIRLTSNDTFTHGLFIADFAHMPASTCGTWPAFWAFNNQDGTTWPEGGELEIIEGANNAHRNLFSAHTAAGCHAPVDGFSGEQIRSDCSPDTYNIGCNYAPPTSDTASYGDAFNAEGGGVYALEWDATALKLWHFPRSTIPDNIVYAPAVGPDPSTWGPPQAVFGGPGCDPDTYFFNLSLVLSINFCGDYAGALWRRTDQCAQLAPTCEDFVAGSPANFADTYWDVGYIDVYQKAAAAAAAVVPRDVAPTQTRTITIARHYPRQSGTLGIRIRVTVARQLDLGFGGESTGEPR